MKIKAFTVDGPLPTEIPALRDIEKAFPSQWMGFANVVVRHPVKARYEREIDLIVVTDDRILMVDLKHWKGRLELVDGYWHQDGERKAKSPVETMRENTILLRNVFKAESFKLGVPRVDGVVVLTHPRCDTSLLAQDASAVMRLDDFLDLKDPDRYAAHFTKFTSNTGNALTGAKNKEHVLRFFSPGKVFEPRKTRFSGYEVVDPQPEFGTSLFSEYLARDVESPSATALLRVWDFTNDEELRHGSERKELLVRERAVIHHLIDRNPELASVPLRERDRDPELGPRHWELFDRDRHLRRLSKQIVAGDDLRHDERRELVKVLSGHVAGLHRAEVAHRDIGLHSVWVDPARARVSLSSFGAAWFPERRTLGLLRAKVLGAGLVLPEDTGVVAQGSAYRQDVFLLGLAAWRLLGGESPPLETDVPDWTKLGEEAKGIVPPALREWFDKCLDWDPASRYADGIAAHDALISALRIGQAQLGAVDLSAYESDIDPVVDYRPDTMIERTRCRVYTTTVDGETMLVKNWPDRMIGERSRNAAKLVEFFARAERLRGSGTGRLPRVREACLSLDGLFLLQDYAPGEVLEDTDVSTWTPEKFRHFSALLIDAVEEAHVLGIPHGDLKPANVVVTGGDTPEPRIVDFLDFSTDAAGERATLAYMPAEGGADPFVRDRYAVATVISETAAKVAAVEGAELAKLSEAVDACADPEAPWNTLAPLAAALAEPERTAAGEKVSLVVGFPRCQAPGPMLADDGKYHVVLASNPDEINVVGFDCHLRIAFDRASRAVRSVRVTEATTRTHAWAISKSAMSFAGEVVMFSSTRIDVDGLDGLLAREEFSAWLDAEAPSPPAAEARTDDRRRRAEATSAPRLATARFWHEQIQAEESLRPAVTLLDEPVSDLTRGVMLVPHDDDAEIEGIANGDAVYFNGTRVGAVAEEFTNAGSLAFRASGRARHLKAGDVLLIQSDRNASSLARRSRAVRRILQGLTPITDLVGYFDPGSKAEPYLVGQPVKSVELDRYGLNPDQVAAFHLLWTKGPVGLLQGPPGTGKTTFIAGFAHYALTKGGCRNVLLVSQSHEAVNTAAERIQALMEDTGGLDLLRVANNTDRISSALRKSHVEAVHDQYVSRFEAEAKERMCMIARRLGLPRPFAEDLFEAFEGPVEIARQLERLRSIEDEAEDRDAVSLSGRLEGLAEALGAQLERFGIELGIGTDAGVVEAALVSSVCAAHDVRDMSAVRRWRAVRETGRDWVRTLRTKSRTLEEFLAGSRRLVCGTCVGVGDMKLKITEKTFDLVIVDEAARATSSELAVAMQSANRVLLVGDHKQLPPTMNKELVKELAVATGITEEPELLRSDFERAFGSAYGRAVGVALKRQYRMAPAIGALVSDVFYPDVGLITERGPPGPHYDGLPFPFDAEFAWMDSGSTLGETRKGKSFTNPSEARIIVGMLETLSSHEEFVRDAKADLKDGEPLVGVICMYAQQRELIRDTLATSSVPAEMRSLVKVETVDSYQGKENRIVIVSLVRSNDRGRIGFLDHDNRINVALSRAMDRLVVVGATHLFRSSAGKLPEVLARMEAAGRLSNAGRTRTEAA